MGYYRGEHGYLLMEAVVAIFIVSTALVPISGLFTQALHTIDIAVEYTTATALAQEQIELFKSKDDLFWDNIIFPYQVGPESISGTDFKQTVRAEICSLDPQYPVKQRIIRLSVHVEHLGGRQVTLVTYVLRELPQFLQ
ncbi:type IV pilus modification PilV family protein [Sporomusa malonica]|uniref:Prepilin-type N-terminal cleavage/methylation domain-containing protein n=1 Tax=Sporomusa malonica TaxID=112901 RepID=A0A1W2EB37_9FIRM|nr:hypothetical protein [Sporomusa malonica]SMD06556.1 hypothetical protein SAMN04488500_12287 [Sporomusa malonica]